MLYTAGAAALLYIVGRVMSYYRCKLPATSISRVIDRAVQIFGAAGVTEDGGLAHGWAWSRALRLADGPDEVHQVCHIVRGELEVRPLSEVHLEKC